mmetsp:Transcript_55908/g.100316  ORF Transcript_55908/g.100316 Transcript_55908/m.100316 type:complete len:304 (-) Transcript_55908:73-984(-)
MSWVTVACLVVTALIVALYLFRQPPAFPLPEQPISPGAAPHALIRSLDLRASFEMHRDLLHRSPPAVLLLGDCIVSHWHHQGRDAWRRHFGRRKMLPIGGVGDRTQHLLGSLQAGLLEGLEDSVHLVFLNIGINNFGADGLMEEEPAFVAAGVAACVKELRKRLPRAIIVILHVFPTRLGRVKQELVNAINSRITLPFFQITNKLLPPEVHVRSINSNLLRGLSLEDLVPKDQDFHLSSAAYDRYAQALLDIISELAPPNAREDLDEASYRVWAHDSISNATNLQEEHLKRLGYQEGLVHLDL